MFDQLGKADGNKVLSTNKKQTHAKQVCFCFLLFVCFFVLTKTPKDETLSFDQFGEVFATSGHEDVKQWLIAAW